MLNKCTPAQIALYPACRGERFSFTFVKCDGAKIVAVGNNKTLSPLGLKKLSPLFVN